MKKTLLSALIICLFCGNSKAQQTNPWEAAKNTSFTLVKKQIPNKNLFKLNLGLLKTELLKTAKRGVATNTLEKKIIYFPVNGGEFLAFEVTELTTLAPALAEKYSDIKSYEGVATNNPLTKIRFSIDVFGFHGMLLDEGGSAYINPTAFGSNLYYLALKSELDPTPFECGVIDENLNEKKNTTNKISTVTDGRLRTFRLALACTAEFAIYHINRAGVASGTETVKKAAVLSAMNTIMTRVNGVFERDLSLTMQIIPNNDLIIFLDPATDGYTNSTTNTMLGENQINIDTQIGNANYDIGHVFSTSNGGVAFRRSPCRTTSKAYGVTGLPNPIGDAFAIDYVAHEMGHQYGAGHTFNNLCGNNIASATAVEPGSGSTIMAYAGVCSPDVQSNSNDYFHAVSIAEIYLNITTQNSTCANLTPSANIAPIVNAGNDYKIPKGTAFVLEGTATDANTNPVDVLTYTWEQLDTEVVSHPPLANATNGPAFRSITPSTLPKRYFPKTSDILANNLTPTWEVVSNVGRNYNFSFLARDNRSGGGQTGRDNALVTSINTAGPFVITSQTTASTLTAGSIIPVTWNVANTNLAPINTNEVDIYLIINNNFENLVSVAQDTPNDGAANVVVPGGITSNNVRIMVRANNNIYFDINNAVLRIQPGSNFSINTNKLKHEVCQPNNINFSFNYITFNGFNETTTFTASSVPAGLNVTFNPTTASANNTTIQVTISGTGALPEGYNNFNIDATATSINKQYPIDIIADSNSFPALVLSSPANNATAIDFKPNFTWGNITKADQYIFELSATNTFVSILETATLLSNNYTVQTSLNPQTQYFWRVKALNQCGDGNFSNINSFTTNSESCNSYINNTVTPISATSPVVVTSTIDVTALGNLSDISVDVELTHMFLSDLNIQLISPSNTIISLIARACTNRDDLNATFSDAGVALICSSLPPAVSGTVKPQATLSSLIGESIAGTWTLRVTDNITGNGGNLLKFGLNIYIPTPTLGLEEVNLDSSLKMYPNPFTTTISIQNPDFIEKTKVEVFTLTGVKVHAETINPKANGEITVNLETLSSGIYLMALETNKTKTVKKIIKL